MGTAKSNVIKLTNRLKKKGFEIEKSHGYGYSTAFVSKSGFFVYISINDGDSEFLIRTALNKKDYTGGTNSFVNVTSSFEDAIKRVELKLNESIRLYLDTNSVAIVDYPMISLTYDLGDSDDAERFKNKFDLAANSEKFSLDIPPIEILPDDENTWCIANVEVDLSEINNPSLLKDFISFADSI
jgi:hypothetical protein